jgi:predicted transposase YbfD/YdcC
MQLQDTDYTYEGPLEGISVISDPRYQVLVWYSIPEVLFLLLSASVSFCNSAIQIATFGEEKLDWLRQYYPYKHGTPSHDTLNRILAMIQPAQFEHWFSEWTAARFSIPVDELLAIDGKRLANSANRMDQCKSRAQGGDYAKIVVNCLAVASGIVLGQRDVSSKASEPEGARQLIESLDVKGKCISGDANFCGFKLLELIIEQGADYLITLKGRNSKLFTAAQEAFSDDSIEKEEFETIEKGHGREERRRYRSIPATTIEKTITTPYSQLSTLVEVLRHRKETRKSDEFTIETHYYVTSLSSDIMSLSKKIRQHWAIENSLHHVLDVGFEEDASRMRKGYASTNFSIVRKIAMNYLLPEKSKAGMKQMRMRAAFSDKKRTELFQI